MERYVIIAEYQGIPHFLQHRNVLATFFYNNRPKTYRDKQRAIAQAKRLDARRTTDRISVIGLPVDYEGSVQDVYRDYFKTGNNVVFTTPNNNAQV